MPTTNAFDYALVRVVPHVEREEFINVGVILFCPTRHFLGAHLHLDLERVRALAPDADLPMIQTQLDLIPSVCAGGASAGAIGQLNQAERFHWLVAPRSTTIQVSPVHSGLCDDPQAELDALFDKMVK